MSSLYRRRLFALMTTEPREDAAIAWHRVTRKVRTRIQIGPEVVLRPLGRTAPGRRAVREPGALQLPWRDVSELTAGRSVDIAGEIDHEPRRWKASLLGIDHYTPRRAVA
jgi:hypothetical protein